MESPHETLNPGQDTYQVDPNGFKATCPAGYTVIGTGFNANIGQADNVINYGGSLVGGFVYNNSSIQIHDVYVQAICAVVPGGASAASATRSRIAAEASYRARLKSLHALLVHR